jgi:hypothetical protein
MAIYAPPGGHIHGKRDTSIAAVAYGATTVWAYHTTYCVSVCRQPFFTARSGPQQPHAIAVRMRKHVHARCVDTLRSRLAKVQNARLK